MTNAFNPNAPFRQANNRPAELVQIFPTGKLLVWRQLADGNWEHRIYRGDGSFNSNGAASKWDLINMGVAS